MKMNGEYTEGMIIDTVCIAYDLGVAVFEREMEASLEDTNDIAIWDWSLAIPGIDAGSYGSRWPLAIVLEAHRAGLVTMTNGDFLVSRV